jgi:hypothetical protein
MKISSRIIIDLEIDSEVYTMPVDSDVEEEMSDFINNIFYEVEGVDIAKITTLQKKQKK